MVLLRNCQRKKKPKAKAKSAARSTVSSPSLSSNSSGYNTISNVSSSNEFYDTDRYFSGESYSCYANPVDDSKAHNFVKYTKSQPEVQIERLRKSLQRNVKNDKHRGDDKARENFVAKQLQEQILQASYRSKVPDTCWNQLYLLPNTPPLSKEQRRLHTTPIPAVGATSPVGHEYIETFIDSVSSLDWEEQMRSFIDGDGKCVGITPVDGRPIVAGILNRRCPVVLKDLVKTINCSLHQAFNTKELFWSSLQINVDTVAACHKDTGNIGLSAYVLTGEFTGGELWIHYDRSLCGPGFSNVPGTQYDLTTKFHTRNTWLIFDRHKYHESMKFQLQSKPVPSSTFGLRSPLRLSTETLYRWVLTRIDLQSYNGRLASSSRFRIQLAI